VLAAPQRDEGALAAAERAALDGVTLARVGERPLDVDRQLRDLGRVLEGL
jgi:hypothetical protein